MTVNIEDKNFTSRLVKELNAIKGKRIIVGIFGEEGTDILIIASVNEFGTTITVTPKMRAFLHGQGLHLRNSTTSINIPERSYIRSGYDNRKDSIIAFAQNRLIELYNFRITAEQYLNGLGEYITGQIRDYMTSLTTPPNHPYTIQKKKSSNPLIDTGRLRQSITYKIE